MSHSGISRTSIQRDHALVTPESHVPLHIPGWTEALTVVLVSREIGAGFGQYLVHAGNGTHMEALNPLNEYLVMVLDGSVDLCLGDGKGEAGEIEVLEAEGFAYLPPASSWSIHASGTAELLVFEKRYVPVPGVEAPAGFVSRTSEIEAVPFLGDPGALLTCLLPTGMAWDWGINVFEFAPGGTLPNVETHFMEHGLYMLAGQGVYRLGERWYPVLSGDAIWMSPYLTQWFAATGKSATRYIYYKEMHRVPAV